MAMKKTQEMKFVDTVNDGICMHKIAFYIYRSINGKVEKYRIIDLWVHTTSVIFVNYDRGNMTGVGQERATQQDLRMLTEQARLMQGRLLQKQQAAKKEQFSTISRYSS